MPILSAREVEQLIGIWKELMVEETPIVVEGRKDVRALRALGIRGPLAQLGRSVGECVERLKAMGAREAIVLTDFNSRGFELATLLASELRKAGLKPNLVYRERLSGLLKGKVKDIEGLQSFISRSLPEVLSSLEREARR